MCRRKSSSTCLEESKNSNRNLSDDEADDDLDNLLFSETCSNYTVDINEGV